MRVLRLPCAASREMFGFHVLSKVAAECSKHYHLKDKYLFASA